MRHFLNLAIDVFSHSWASAYERPATYLAAVHLWTKGTSDQGTKMCYKCIGGLWSWADERPSGHEQDFDHLVIRSPGNNP